MGKVIVSFEFVAIKYSKMLMNEGGISSPSNKNLKTRIFTNSDTHNSCYVQLMLIFSLNTIACLGKIGLKLLQRLRQFKEMQEILQEILLHKIDQL